MKTVTLAQLRALCRLYADQRESEFVTDPELDVLINLMIGELYDMLVAARGHEHYQATDTVDIDTGSSLYDLPDDFYQLIAVSLEWDEHDVEPVDALNSLQDAWKYQGANNVWQRWSDKAYRVQGESLVFYPTPSAPVTARIHYIPVFTDLVEGEDTFNGVNGWEKMVGLGVGAELLEIEEVGSGLRLREAFERQVLRIEGLAADRDASQEIQVRDVRGRRLRYPTATGTTQ